MTAPSNANTSGLAPTDALRLVLDLARKGAKTPGCNNWRAASMCRQIVEVLDKAAPASPLPGGGYEDLIAELKEARAIMADVQRSTQGPSLDGRIRAFLARSGKGEGK